MNWIGQALGGHIIDKEIAQGGMATVYRAYQPKLERWVAIKVIPSTDETFLQRFRDEARAVAALQHPNILPIYDYGEEENAAYIIMEYIPGGTLANLLTGRPLRWPDIASLILSTGNALAFAHSQGIIHCDVKPSNILLPRTDWPLLTDFGLFRLKESQSEATQTDQIVGTPAYVSPEQVAGVPLDARSDVYSLGIVMYEMLTGRLPFKGFSTDDVMWQRLTQTPPRPALFNHHISSELEHIILQALAREPDSRIPNMQTLLQRLQALPEGLVATGGFPRPITDQLTSTRGLKDSQHQVQGPYLLAAGTESPIPLPGKGEIILGRAGTTSDREATVDLTPYGGVEAGVSRLHARLQQIEGDWFLTDLGSTNGTSLNMRPLQSGETLQISGGDIIRCGRLMLVFYEKGQ